VRNKHRTYRNVRSTHRIEHMCERVARNVWERMNHRIKTSEMKGRFPRTYRNVKQCQTFMGCSYRTDGNVCLRPKCHSRIGWAQARSQHAHSCFSVQHQAMPFERTDRCTISASPKPTLHQILLVFIVFLCSICYFSSTN
jgi:hypothetical protein